MTVTYNQALATDKDRIRFYIQDTVEGKGPKVSDVNFSDEEIAGLVTLEGSWQAAVAACFEALSANWQDNPVFGVGDLGTTHGRIAEGFAKKAEAWRARSASSTAAGGVGYVSTTRKDGYSQTVKSLTVTT